MDETRVVECMALIAHDQLPEIAQPSEEPLNFPPPSVPAQRTAIGGSWDGCGCVDGAQSSQSLAAPELHPTDRHRSRDRQSADGGGHR